MKRRARKRRQRLASRITWERVGIAFLIMSVAFLLTSTVYARFVIPARNKRLPGVGGEVLPPEGSDVSHTDDPSDAQGTDNTPDSPGASEETDEVTLDDAELAALHVNELGDVIIVMYHDVQDYEAEWVRSRDNLRKDLERFYNLGYTLVPLKDYLSGTMNVPAGRSPLVLTFDDGTRGQLRLIEKGGELVADPECAVGILLEFSHEHPEFGHAATFFINSGNPFGDASRVKENLSFLVEHGMDIGNHTRTHRNLSSTTPDETAKEIGSLANEVMDAIGYKVVSLALPYGAYPKSEEFLLSGVWDGREYTNLGVLLVGAEPGPSPYSTHFNPLAVPRVRGSQEELDKWLGELEKYPERRYVSDGRSAVITVCEGDPRLDENRVGDLEVRTLPRN